MNILETRLASKIVQSGGCLIWTGAKNRKGYGSAYWNGRSRKVHRLSYELFHGSIPEGMSVCHHCDTPACVNVDHLFAGSNKDYMIDAVRKGRLKTITSDQAHFRSGHAPRGQSASGAKLTEHQAREIILKRKTSGIPTKILAAEYGVDRTTIQRLVRGQNWKILSGRAALAREEG